MKNDFNFYLPADIDISKSDNGEGERRIRGYASNEFRDRQDELIVQKGLDISNFVNFGWFNYDHKNDCILGYPDKEKTKITKKGFYVEGTLLKGVPLADKMWNLAVSLKKSNAPRKLGFSVEGKILKRSDSGKILKAEIYNVAITPNPVNPTATWEAVCKSFNDVEDQEIFNDDSIDKSCEAGYEVKMNEENTGSSLKKESLDTSFKKIASLNEDSDEAKEKKKQLRESLINKSLNVNEAILYLQVYKGLSKADATQIAFKYIK